MIDPGLKRPGFYLRTIIFNEMNLDKLNNPAWHSLNEIHHEFAIGNDDIKFYQPCICPFGGINANHYDLELFLKSHPELNSFFIIGEKPQQFPGLIIETELVCLQMICPAPIYYTITENIIYLNNDHKQQLIELVNLVQPGYFKEGTIQMGDYFGIFHNDKLVAITGERMKMFGFTEISAIVTHPQFTGRGLAKQLITYTVNKIFDQGIIPYLHVTETNTNAIKLYEKLGFTTRRKISLWKMKKL